MRKLNDLQTLIEDLRLEELKIQQCQKAFGEFIFELHQNGAIHDEQLNLKLNNIINNINPKKHELSFFGF